MNESHKKKIVEQLEVIRYKTPPRGNRSHNMGDSYNLEMQKLCKLCGISKKYLDNYLIPNVDFLENGKIGWDRFDCRTKRIESYINNNLFSLDSISDEQKIAFKTVAKIRESVRLYPELVEDIKHKALEYIATINKTTSRAENKIGIYENEISRFYNKIKKSPEGFSFSEKIKSKYKDILCNPDGTIKYEYQRKNIEANAYIQGLEWEIAKQQAILDRDINSGITIQGKKETEPQAIKRKRSKEKNIIYKITGYGSPYYKLEAIANDLGIPISTFKKYLKTVELFKNGIKRYQNSSDTIENGYYIASKTKDSMIKCWKSKARNYKRAKK